jgi:hypothetical protein
MTSQTRIDANRENARHSTGPRTAEGKARSRLNGLVHGLRSEQVVLPTEDPAEFDAHVAEYLDEWKPPTITRMDLVEHLAATAWRLNRCVRIETARLSERSLVVLEKWDHAEEEMIDAAVKELRSGPTAPLRWLKQTRPGVDRLIELSEQLIDDLTGPGGWLDYERHHVRLLNLQGFTPDDPRATEYADVSWRLLLTDRPDLAGPNSPPPFPPEVADQIRASIQRILASNIVLFRDLREQLPDASGARIRRAELAAFEFDPQDVALQRYEGRLDREYRSTLNQLMSLTKSGIDLVAVPFAPTDPNSIAPDQHAPTEPNRPSSVAETVVGKKVKADAKAKGPGRSGPPEPVAPSEPNDLDTSPPSLTVDRDRGGRIWPVAGVEIDPINP